MFETVCLIFQFSMPKHTELENILNWKKLGSPPLLNAISKHTESEFQNPIQYVKKVIQYVLVKSDSVCLTY